MRRFLTGSGAILTVVFLIAGCSSSDDTADVATTAAPVTTVAPDGTVAAPATTTTAVVTTEAVPASDGVVANFDGATCTYRGPERVSPTAPLAISFTNESDVTAGLFVVSPRSEELEEIRSLIGQDLEADHPARPLPNVIALEMKADPGESAAQEVLLGPGIWIVDCRTWKPGIVGAAHVWFVAVVESK